MMSALFKWLHLALSQELLLIGAIGVTVVYLLYAAKKERHHLLEILKISWVPSAFIGSALIFLKVVPANWIWVPTLILIFSVFVFYRQEKQSLKEK